MTAGIVDIRGKAYQTVAKRVVDFRREHPQWSIATEILDRDDAMVLMRAVIADQSGVTIATGHAEELRSASNINAVSAVENCETSAIGRALAFVGYATDADIASADEIERHKEKAAADARDRLEATMYECRDSIAEVCDALDNEQYERAFEAMNELTSEQKQTLWIAPTKAKAMGVEPPFTTKHIAQMKSNEWAAARRAMTESAA